MKLAVTLNQIEALEAYLNKPIDAIIIGLKDYAQRIENTFDSETIKDTVLAIKAHDKNVYISMNIIMHDHQIEGLYEALNVLKTLPIDGILFADLAVYMAAESLKMTDLLIYYPETYVTSLEDCLFWHQQKIKAVILARELTLDDITMIAKKSPVPTFVVGHGYLNMFHSRRPLVENYFKYTHDQDPEAVKHKKTLTLVEEKRSESYKVIQDGFGTHVFRAKPLESLSVLEALTDLDTLIIDTAFIDASETLTIIDDYVKKINGEQVDISFYEKTHDQGFYFKKTVLKKEGDA
jgi:putative protease